MKAVSAAITLMITLMILTGCGKPQTSAKSNPLESAYGIENDWNDPQTGIPLNYQQAQGRRIFYIDCVWCHADATPAGPSNRSNLTPTPALANDGAVLNSLSDGYLQNIITLGGSAMSKSAMMPPWGKTLKQEDIHSVITFIRAIARPAYRPSALSTSQYRGK